MYIFSLIKRSLWPYLDPVNFQSLVGLRVRHLDKDDCFTCEEFDGDFTIVKHRGDYTDVKDRLGNIRSMPVWLKVKKLETII